MECLETKIDLLAKQVVIGLVVIDSIAAPIRSEFEMKDSRERNLAIHKVGNAINKLARKLNAPIVLLNQVKWPIFLFLLDCEEIRSLLASVF